MPHQVPWISSKRTRLIGLHSSGPSGSLRSSGESLLPIFEIEGARLDEGARTAVARAVADALNAATSEVLAQHNLEPVNLAKYLLGLHPARSHHFSDDEGQLYERIVTESCTYIVDIASQLPQFTERTLAEILKREGQLITIAEKILQEVARMRAQLDPHLEAARFELDYRRAVVRHLDEMELFGSGTSVTSRDSIFPPEGKLSLCRDKWQVLH